jgi:hypothetical protein
VEPSPLPYDLGVLFASVEDVECALSEESYLPDRGLATAVFLALAMRRPLLLEGEAGVGKTEVGKTLARILRAELIRLQCYEGIDASQALYEWDYARQLLYARALQVGEVDPGKRVEELYGADFLVERPLLKAIRSGAGAVLLIDELDRADDEFEAFLLDGRRLYVTNSLYSTWDNQFYPELRSWLLRVNCGPDGGMEVDPDFFVDLHGRPKGPARAHEVRLQGGDCTTEIFQ